jgi:hypothetical protein
MEIFSFFSFPPRRVSQKDGEGRAKGQSGVRVRALYVTSSRDCRTALYSPFSAIACVGFESYVSVQMAFEGKRLKSV